jgi:hypothetical protein
VLVKFQANKRCKPGKFMRQFFWAALVFLDNLPQFTIVSKLGGRKEGK